MAVSAAESLLVIAAVAVLAPLLAEWTRRWRVPAVLFELLLGIIVGPALLGWVEMGPFIDGLRQLGLAMLFFMAGYEIDVQRLRGAPLNRALAGWGTSMALGLGLGAVLAARGVVQSGLILGLALTTTAMGTLLPVLRDRELLDTRFGRFTTAAGAVGEFGPIVAITILLSAAKPWQESMLLVAFGVLALVVGFLLTRPQSPRVVETLQRHLSTSTQLPVRILLLLIIGLTLLAAQLGLDNLLGAFAAGAIARLALSPRQNRDLSPRLEAVGFGFVIPIFFITSGVDFDLDSLLESPTAIAQLLALATAMLVVRGLPAMVVYRGLLSVRHRAGLAVLQSTALPLLVVLSEIGKENDHMSSATAAALVGSGMLTVLVFPLASFAIAGEVTGTADATTDPDRPEPVEPDEFGEL